METGQLLRSGRAPITARLAINAHSKFWVHIYLCYCMPRLESQAEDMSGNDSQLETPIWYTYMTRLFEALYVH